MNNAEQKVNQELVMNELLHDLTVEGEELAVAFRELQDSLKRPDGEIRELLESDENIDFSISELEEKMNRFTEEARNKDYEELSPEEYHQIHNYGTEYDDVMFERYQKAVNYRKNIEEKLNAVDNQLKRMDDTFNKFIDADVMKQIKAAYKQAEKQRKAGDSAAKEYAESLKDFIEFYEYFNDLRANLREKISDRRNNFDAEFNAKREAVAENNKRINAEIEAIRDEIAPLEVELENLELEIERKERKKEYDEEYKKYVERKNEINDRLSELRHQIGQKQSLLQKMPTFDYNFNAYSINQKDIIDLEIDMKKEAAQMADLENEMKKRSMDALKSTPRFEFFLDSDGKIVTSIVVNGVTKTKTIGDYKDVSYEQIAQVVKNLILTVAAGSVGLDLNTVARYNFRIAQVTPEGLEYQKSENGVDTFKHVEVSKFIYEYANGLVKQDQLLDDLRNNIDLDDEPKKDGDQPDQPNPDEPSKDGDQPDQPNPDEPSKDGDQPEQPEPEEPEKDGEQPEQPEPEEPEKDGEQPEQPEPEEPDKNNDKGYRVVSARPFTFNPSLKVGATSKQALAQNPELKRYNEELMSKTKTKRVLLTVMTLGTFGVALTNPMIATALAFGGTCGIATILSQLPHAATLGRKHKLEKLAKDMGLKVGYILNDDHYEIGFVDPKNPTVKLSNEEIKEIGGARAQEVLDKIADNKTRGEGTVNARYKQKQIDKAADTYFEKLSDLYAPYGLKIDELYFNHTNEVHLIDANEDVDLNVEWTPEVKEACQARFLDTKLEEYVNLEDAEKVVEDRNKITEEYKDKIEEIDSKDYTTRLLWNFKDRRISERRDLKKVSFENLECLFDDLGGVTIPKKGRLRSWIDKRFATPDTIVHDEQEVAVQVEEQPVDEEVPSNENNLDQDAPAQTAPEVESEDVQLDQPEAEPTPAAPSEDEGLDIQEAILNATTEGREEAPNEDLLAEGVQAVMAEEQSVPSATVAEEAPVQEGPTSEELQAYMEATIDSVQDTLPDLMKTHPEEAEKFVVNHPEFQELYDQLSASLNTEDQGLRM